MRFREPAIYTAWHPRTSPIVVEKSEDFTSVNSIVAEKLATLRGRSISHSLQRLSSNELPHSAIGSRVGVDAGLRAGWRLYWMGVMGYKPKACRILLTEKNRETKLLSDRPRWGYGPWWCGHKK